MSEEWRAVVGFEGFYEVSDLGRVRSIPREYTQIGKNGALCKRVCAGGVRKTRPDAYGYSSIGLNAPKKGSSSRKQRRAKVCWLVMEAFVGPRPPKHDVCHNNGDRSDDRLENLRYGTRKENIQDAKKHGTFPTGEKNGQSKLTWDCARAIRKLYKEEGVSMEKLGRGFSISTTTIFNIIHNKVWVDG